MAEQPMTEFGLPDAGPTLAPQLGPLAGDDDSQLKSELIDEIFGVAELEPAPGMCAEPAESSRASLRTSLEEEPPAENLETVALNLEHALSGIFDEVEGAGAGEGGQVVSNGQPEPASETSVQGPRHKATSGAAGTAEDDDDIVVLDEVTPVTAPAARKKPRLLGPASKRKANQVAVGTGVKVKGALLGPASKRKDFALLGPPSSRMPVDTDSSDCESEPARTPEEMKMMGEARRLKMHINLRLNNVCLETSQTSRQWAVTLQQRRDARKRHWEEVRRGPRPAPAPRRTSRARARGGKHGASPSAAAAAAAAAASAAVRTPPVNFAATKQLMSLINRGVVQMTSVGGSPPVNGRPRLATPQRGRGRAMVQIPTGNLQQRHLAPTGRGGVRAGPAAPRPKDRVVVRPPAGAADLAAIPDLGEKQRMQLLKLLKGNNGTSISPASAEPPPAPPASKRSRPAPPPPRPPEPAPLTPPEPDQPSMIPSYCHTTSGSPDDLFSVYLSAPQQPEKCFVNMQINNHCLKVRLPARPSATGMVFAQVTRSAMEPVCQITVGSSTFTPPTLAGQTPALAARPGPKSRQQAAEKKTHACPKCSQAFPSASTLEYHFKVYHAPVSSVSNSKGIFDCPLCTSWWGPFANLGAHVTEAHAPQGVANFTCSICGRSWSRRTADAQDLWSRHVIWHAKPHASYGHFVPSSGTPPAVGARAGRTRRAVRPTAGAPRAQPPASSTFSCPQCNAVFADVSKFPEHWLKVHSGGAGGGAPAASAPRPASRSAPARRAVRSRPQGRETRFSARFNSQAVPSTRAPSAAGATAAVSSPAESGGTLRCTRCRELFPNEAAYAQHWINAHTRIRLSADQQAATGAAAPASGAKPAGGSTSRSAVTAAGMARTAATDSPSVAAADHSAMDVSEDGAAVTSVAEDVPMERVADGGDGDHVDSAAAAAAAEQNGLGRVAPDGGAGEPAAAPLDPVAEAAALVPSQADLDMSEETLDKMLQQIIPDRPRK